MKILLTIISMSFIFGSKIKEEDIVEFLDAKYGGDTSTVNNYLSDDFFHYNAPFVGLGIKGNYVDGSILVTTVLNDSILNYINIGDRIHEFNGKIISKNGIKTNGAVGDLQKLVITRNNDSLFSELDVPLLKLQVKENLDSYLKTIKDYSELWYEYDFQILDFIYKKEKVVVHYNWEGSLKKNGKVYFFTAIELLTFDKKSELILKDETFWNELQFKSQFK